MEVTGFQCYGRPPCWPPLRSLALEGLVTVIFLASDNQILAVMCIQSDCISTHRPFCRQFGRLLGVFGLSEYPSTDVLLQAKVKGTLT